MIRSAVGNLPQLMHESPDVHDIAGEMQTLNLGATLGESSGCKATDTLDKQKAQDCQKVANTTFDRLALVLIKEIAHLTCFTVEEFFAFRGVCRVFNEASDSALKKNPELLVKLCGKKVTDREFLKGIPASLRGLIEKLRHNVVSFEFSGSLISINVSAIVRIFPNVTKVSFSDCDFIGTNYLFPLAKKPLRELSIIEVVNPSICAEIQFISRISTLQKLALVGSDSWLPELFTYENFHLLQNLQELQELRIERWPIRNQDLAHIPKQNLTSLSLAFCEDITNEGLGSLRDAKKLQKLDLSATKVTEMGLYIIGNLSITHLKLREIKGVNLRGLQHITCLEELDLAYSSFIGAAIQPLQKAINLTKLNLQGCNLVGPILENLASPQHKLRVLNLRFTQYLDRFVPIPTLTCLTLTDFHGLLEINDEFLANISQNIGTLETLEISATAVSDIGLQSLASLKKLSLLCLRVPRKLKGEERERMWLSRLTPRGVQQLRLKQPRVSVYVDLEKSHS